MLLLKHKIFYTTLLLSSFYPYLASANTIFDDELGCNCAKDLILNNHIFINNKNSIVNNFSDSKISKNTSYFLSQNQEKNESIPDFNKWRFQFQPYVTVPLNTYGTATARGRSADYHLSLGETLDALNFTASARFEAWKGRFGIIFDGYYVNLGDVTNLQRQVTRTPSALNAVNYLMSKATNTRVTELASNLDRKIETAKQDAQLKESEIIQQLDQQIDDLENALTQDLDRIENIDAKVTVIRDELAQFSDSRINDINLEDLQDFELTEAGFRELLALNVRDFSKIQDLQELNQRISDIGILSNIPEIEQELIATRDILEEGLQRVKQEREMKDTEELQQLEAEITSAKALVDEELTKIQKTEDFLENRTPQNLDVTSQTNLNFQQGIYDFALSYHFGDIPNNRLPDKPSGRNYPLIWFQPIAGVRLNNISINIEETINVVATSSLVNFNGSFQNNYGQTRTWLEPMLGAKMGLQLSDRISLWLRGDASGFGLAGETDMSWNLLGGMDWWIGYNTSLQLGYRFYEIDYAWGSGSNKFGFKESFNGPFLSATFHF